MTAKFCSSQNEEWKWTFWERILLSRQTAPYSTTSVANSLLKQRKKVNTPHKWRSSQLSQEPITSKEAVKDTGFQDGLSLNESLEQANRAVLRRNVFQRKELKTTVGQKRENNEKKTKYDINVFLKFNTRKAIWCYISVVNTKWSNLIGCYA